MIPEDNLVNVCAHCGGARLHAGDTVALSEAMEPEVARSLRALARSLGLRVLLRPGPGTVTLDLRTAQQRIADICPEGAGSWPAASRLGKGSGRQRSSGSDLDRLADDDTLGPSSPQWPEPERPGRPRRTLFRHPVSRDPMFWAGTAAAFVAGLLAAQASPQVNATLRESAWPWLSIAMRALTPSDISVALMGVAAMTAWLVIACVPAIIRRSIRRRMDREALLLPPPDRLPGWRDDPTGAGSWRWWNGMSWTGAVRPHQRTGWLWPIIPIVLLGVLAAVTVSRSSGTLSITLPTWPPAATSPAAPMGADAPTGSSAAAYPAALADVDTALLAYSAAARTDPLGPAAVSALADLQRAAARLTAVTTDEPGDTGARQDLQGALGAYVDVLTGMTDEGASCAADRPDVVACRAAVVQRWQERIGDTLGPLAQAYADVSSPSAQGRP